MGCDIHMWLEYERWPAEESGLSGWSALVKDIGPRNYTLFGWLAGVRRDPPELIVPRRGMPEGELSFAVDQAAHLYVSDTHFNDEGCCSVAQAKAWGVAERDDQGNPIKAMHPDWHSHSWLTIDEYAQILAAYTMHERSPPGVEYTALLAAARHLEDAGKKARVVFWFDN